MTEVRDGVDDDDDELLIVEEIEPAAASRRRRRIALVVVVLAFVVTRGVAGYVAQRPVEVYGSQRVDASGDIGRYDELSWEMRHEDLSPYGTTLRMEYPPGAIPIIMVPRYVRVISYHAEFVAMMVFLDAVGLLALWRIAKRGGSWFGFATWFVLIPAIGPVAYTRLDLVVAVLLVWTIERALAGRWEWVGLLIGLGAAVKLVPIVLLPLLFFVAPRDRRRAMVAWCAGVVGLAVLPWIDRLPDLYGSVVTYHNERGIQAESLWGMLVMAARWVGDYAVVIVPSHGAYDAQSDVSEALKTLSSVALAVVVLTGLVLAIRTKVGDVARATLLLFGVLSLMVGLSKVYSPQYVVWLIGLAAAAMAVAPRQAAPAVAVLAVVTVLSHLLFPIWFWDLLFFDKGGALIALGVRDTLTVVVGLLALWGWRSHCHTPSAEWRYGRRRLGAADRL